MLKAPVDEILAFFRDILRNLRPLVTLKLRLEREQYIRLGVEAITPRILPREHFNDQATKGPYV